MQMISLTELLLFFDFYWNLYIKIKNFQNYSVVCIAFNLYFDNFSFCFKLFLHLIPTYRINEFLLDLNFLQSNLTLFTYQAMNHKLDSAINWLQRAMVLNLNQSKYHNQKARSSFICVYNCFFALRTIDPHKKVMILKLRHKSLTRTNPCQLLAVLNVNKMQKETICYQHHLRLNYCTK